MGSSGGIFGDKSTNDINKLIEEAKESTRDKDYERGIAEFISILLSTYNERDVESIRRHLDEIETFIEDEFGGAIDLRFGGSVSKHTYVDGLSDVDVLLLINKLDLSRLSPRDVLKKIQKELSDRRFRDIKDINVGKLAITVTFTDNTEIQFLPAIKRGEGFKIPTESGDAWSSIIRPDKFAERLTDINQSCGLKVVPVIKLVKGINSQFPESQQLKGYHIESLAIEIFKSYPESSPKTPKEMLKYFFEKGRDLIKTPIRDRTGQSINVDEYLGLENSKDRLRLSNTLDIYYRRMNDADTMGDISRWKSILGI
jgi:hypothetical protein